MKKDNENKKKKNRIKLYIIKDNINYTIIQ